MKLPAAFRIPLALRGGLNAREHWAARRRRVKTERSVTALFLPRPAPPVPAAGLVVRLSRVAPRALDDDNNVGRLKSVRDEVARWLGIDDRDARVSWRYAQAKPGQPKQHVVLVEVFNAAEEA